MSDNPTTLQTELELAKKFMDHSKYKKALDIVTDLDKKHPHDEEVILLLAECYFHLDEIKLCQTTLMDAIEYWPDWFMPPMALADYLIEYGELDLAAKWYQYAMTNDPEITVEDLAIVHIGLGKAFCGLNKCRSAVAAWNQAHKLDPENPDTEECLTDCSYRGVEVTEFDAFDLFKEIQSAKYECMTDGEDFVAVSEVAMFDDLLRDEWNKLELENGSALHKMTEDEAILLFEAVDPDFKECLAQRKKDGNTIVRVKKGMAEPETKEDQMMFTLLERTIPDMPPYRSLLVLTVGAPILESAGITNDRQIRIMTGSPLTKHEKGIFLWADDLIEAIGISTECTEERDSAMWIGAAKEIARKVLAEKKAGAVIAEVRTMIRKIH